VSMSATVVARGAAVRAGDRELGDALAGTMEFFGVPLSWGGQKRYGFGLYPVGDAFIAWSASAPPPAAATSHPRLLSPLWRWPAHALAAMVLAIAGWGLLRSRRARPPAR
jgi:hypothetical protein